MNPALFIFRYLRGFYVIYLNTKTINQTHATSRNVPVLYVLRFFIIFIHIGPYTKRVSRDCKVSDWSQWSECSALCGFGEQYRHRYVVSPSRNGGAVCPILTDKRLCNSARDCRLNYFDW